MKNLLIIGAGGMGREVAWLVERINKQNSIWNIIGFIDDSIEKKDKNLNGYKVIGGLDTIEKYPDAYLVCAVGASKTRKSIVDKIHERFPDSEYATLIDPSVEMSDKNIIGEGSIICAHSILTVNIDIGKHVIVNMDCTIGHDAVLNSFVMVYPGVNISGNTNIGTCTELGTGMQIIQGKKIGDNSIVGAGSVVIKDIPENCTAVGCPAKPIKFFE